MDAMMSGCKAQTERGGENIQNQSKPYVYRYHADSQARKAKKRRILAPFCDTES